VHDGRIKARWLALSARTGSWERTALSDRLRRVLPEQIDATRLAARLHVCFGPDKAPRVETLCTFLLHEPLLTALLDPAAESEDAWADDWAADWIDKVDAASDVVQPGITRLALDPPVMSPQLSSLLTGTLPVLETWRDVGRWLGLQDRELAWFSDRWSQQSRVTEPALHHYRYVWTPKRSGGLRLIEAPKPRLRVPPHDAAHAYFRGRSIRSFATPHAAQPVVLKLDLQDFFPSVPTPRIAALFRTLGFPDNVAWLLQGLCTHSVSPSLAGPAFAELSWLQRRQLIDRHLPQGAPTSAALANLCAWRLDCRLSGLAARHGLQYTRYADDLAFSGPASLAGKAGFIETGVGAIVLDEGFSLNHRKTRLRTRAQRQQLAGVIVNEKPNLRRQDWDQLKAILHNCVQHGPESQNRDGHPDFRAHLQGRVSHALWLNPQRGEKLRGLLQQIHWPDRISAAEDR